MSQFECEFESEVLALAVQGRWPDAAGHALRAHAESCPICSDTAAIAGTIEDARQESYRLASPADSARVWRLAQLRARLEAAEAANRPLAAAHGIALLCAIAVLVFSLRASAAWLHAIFDRLAAALPTLDFAVTLATEHTALALAAAALFLLVPAAAYLTLHRDW